MRYICILFSLVLFFSCGSRPKGSFQTYPENETPDYSLEKNWAALPTKKDNADLAPGSLQENQANAPADVFYLHPTNYYGDRSFNRWNAEIDNEKVNKGNDERAILYQASVWNAAGKVYAPRYRQAHYDAYFTKDSLSAKQAFEVAYEDVKSAFAYYMSHYNKGRPFIIASHSQGTTHATRLIQEFIDGKPLENKLIAAYLLGIPVDLDKFNSLKACSTKDDTRCLIGWRTYKTGYEPKTLKLEEGYNVLITNPLTWTSSTELAPPSKHKGALFFDLEEDPTPGTQNAQIHKSILWTNKPKFKGSWLYTTQNYHRGDINLFYVNIRENAVNRVGIYFNNM